MEPLAGVALAWIFLALARNALPDGTLLSRLSYRATNIAEARHIFRGKTLTP